jgi:hypothetical protein
MQTQQQIKGTKFEVFLEVLLKKQGYQNVLRNVEMHKSKYRYRQVDVSYNVVDNGRIYLAIAEAKFSSNGNIPYRLRTPRVKKAGKLVVSFDNLVDEMAERQRFVGANLAVLVTNHSFEDKVKEEAKKHGIRVMEGSRLTDIYHKLGGRGSIDKAIASISLRGRMHKNVIYP